MAISQFAYVTYIRTTPEKLWRALMEPDFTRQYWMGTTQECAWKPGAAWKILFSDGRMADSGEVVEIEPQRKLILNWRNEMFPELTAEGYSRMSYELEQAGETVKLTVRHEMDKSDSKFIKAVSNGWPIILSGLKSLLETGAPIDATLHTP